MLKNKRKNFILSVLLGLVFALVPVSFVQAATTLPLLDSDNISMVNIEGKPSIEVTGLPVGAIVKVYDQDSGGKLLGSATVKTGQTSAIVSLSNLNSDVYVSVTLESAKSKISVAQTVLTQGITVINNAGIADTVTVTDLEVGDIVKVYDQVGTKLLGNATVAKGKTEAIVSITQLGTSTGSVNVTLTSIGEKESNKCVKTYDAEVGTGVLDSGSITVINNAGIADTITVTNLEVGDVVKVYNAATLGKLLGTATVAKGKTEAVVSIPQLGTVSGTVYVTLKSVGKKESERSSGISYEAEPQTYALADHNITIINNAGLADTVTVADDGVISVLEVGDIVKVYNAATAGKLLGTATAVKGKTEAVVAVASIQQLGTGNGTVWVTVTSKGNRESDRCSQIYIAEGQSIAPEDANITVANNTGINDRVTVTGLIAGDIVKVYDDGTAGNLLGKSTVAKDKTEAVVIIRQLGTGAGNVWVTVTSIGKLESVRVVQVYLAQLAL